MNKTIKQFIAVFALAGLFILILVSIVNIKKKSSSYPEQMPLEAAGVVNPPNQTSHVLLQNTSNSNNQVKVTLYNLSGSEIFSNTFTLSAKGSRTLHAGAGTSDSGHLYMNVPAASSSLVVESTEKLVAVNVNYGAPEAYNTYEGLSGTALGTDILAPSIHWRTNQWSLVGIQNAGSQAANASITYYRQDGSQIGSTLSVQIPSNTSHYRYVVNDIGTCSEPCVGSMRVISTNGQNLAVSVIETLGQTTYSYNSFPVSYADTQWSFPSVHRNLSGQYSHILVQNVQPQPASLTLNYYDQQGNLKNSFANITIPANGSLTFHTTNELSTNGGNYTPVSLGNVGAAIITSTNNVKLVATVIETLGSSNLPYSYNGLSPNDKYTTLLFPSVHRNPGGQYSHILVQNASTPSSDNTIRINYYNQDGSLANTFDKVLPANGSITFHTTNDLSTDGRNYTPASLGNVGTAEVISLSGKPLFGVEIETLNGYPAAYAAFH